MRETGNRRFDLITSRAFSQLEQFVVLSAPLLAMGGRMIAMKGPSAIEEIKKSEEILERLAFKIAVVHSYKLPSNAGERNLIIIVRSESA